MSDLAVPIIVDKILLQKSGLCEIYAIEVYEFWNDNVTKGYI
jgi:hypothetical protein